MLTGEMQLTNTEDARLWAGAITEGMDATQEQISRLAEWIWTHKTEYEQDYGSHPVSGLSSEQVWAIMSPTRSAARALRAIPSEVRSATSRANGAKGGRPRKQP